ncbi:hypothetical protein [Nocardia cyriacigeorgica]|nr:hypothetical protein [Nocardia cyriacigeorgica]NEW27261.1 hypothetical protein [Nocardia cyriacigeorgica]
MDHCAHVIAYCIEVARAHCEAFASVIGIPNVLDGLAEDIALAWAHHKAA